MVSALLMVVHLCKASLVYSTVDHMLLQVSMI